MRILRLFKYSFDNFIINIMKNFTIAFDIDNTISTSIRRYHVEDILIVKPRLKMVKMMKELKQRGHTIVIFTRRGQLKNGRRLTIKWLKMHNIPCDKLITRKPHFDVLIDDKVMSTRRGFWSTNIIENQAKWNCEDSPK